MLPKREMIFSDMKFKDYGGDSCWLIEDSDLYMESLRCVGFKTVEFIVYNTANNIEASKLIFVEAKTTLQPEDDGSKFKDVITDISQNFVLEENINS